MKFLNLALILATTSISAATALANPQVATRTYRSAQGKINVDVLEQTLTQRVGTAVSVTNIRWTHNPLAYGAYVVSAIEANPHAEYVIEFNAGVARDSEPVVCDFSVLPKTKQALVYNCQSESGTISVPGFISFEQMGMQE